MYSSIIRIKTKKFIGTIVLIKLYVDVFQYNKD